MLGQTRRHLGASVLLMLVTIAGCAVSAGTLPGGGAFASFTILGTTLRLSLGGNAVFGVTAGGLAVPKAVKLQNVFQGTLPALPAGARVSIPTGSFRATAGTPKAITPGRDASGSFDVIVRIASISADHACEGTMLGTFHVTVEGSNVSFSPGDLDVPQTALDEVLTGSFAICFEVSGDVDATVAIDDVAFSFSDEPAGGEGEGDGEGEQVTFSGTWAIRPSAMADNVDCTCRDAFDQVSMEQCESAITVPLVLEPGQVSLPSGGVLPIPVTLTLGAGGSFTFDTTASMTCEGIEDTAPVNGTGTLDESASPRTLTASFDQVFNQCNCRFENTITLVEQL